MKATCGCFGKLLAHGTILPLALVWAAGAQPPPKAPDPAADLERSAVRSQINSADPRVVLGADPATAQQLRWIQVAPDRSGFVEAGTGKKFTPWGFNYDRDFKMRLLEEYWETEWATIEEDFREMKALGANVVRVHLQFARFMDAPDRANPRSLERLARLLTLAETTGLYLDLTGLACYRKRDVPAWYAALSESERWKAQTRFWEAIAKTCAHSPAVFCYDLINEPMVPSTGRQAGDWLAGELAGFSYVQCITLDLAGRDRAAVAKQWVSALSAAIRTEDSRHLITVGLLPDSADAPPRGSGFLPREIAGELDFVCVHLYPRTGKLKEDLQMLEGFRIGKPVVIEEIFPMTCSLPELREFIRQSRGKVAGYVGFYWGQTPEELGNSTKTGDVLTREWLKLFRSENPNAADKPN